jgi:DNA-binding IclR family transcriptional regulator
LPDADLAVMFAGNEPLPGLTARSITSRSRLLAELRQVRDDGYAVNREESEEGVASVAVAVRGPQRLPIAALTVSAPVSRLTEATGETMKNELKEQAAWLAGRMSGAT